MNMLLIMICMLLMFLNFLLSKKMYKSRNKLTQFDVGLNQYLFSDYPFQYIFFLISIIFLIFDVEISLIFPLIKFLNNMNFYYYKNIFLMIMIVLIFGLYYEWKSGSLKWM
uniref:NADH-ubiquinone oxidoreductase chain 3 n=1 Tax=Latuspina sp. TaxID=3138292 RepID=A0AB38ZLE9_9HYME